MQQPPSQLKATQDLWMSCSTAERVHQHVLDYLDCVST